MKIDSRIGSIVLESHWGDETTIVNTARVSTSDKRVEEIGADDERLLRYLWKNEHHTPFETVNFRFRIVAPIFVLRQWMRHRISSFNEYSGRYRKPIGEWYFPIRDALEVDGIPIMSGDLASRYDRHCNETFKGSSKILKEMYDVIEQENRGPEWRKKARGRARELARNMLPVSQYSEVYWTVNFRSLANFLGLRNHDHAQHEIRQYAIAIDTTLRETHPLLMKTCFGEKK